MPNFSKRGGIIPVIVQDVFSEKVLTLAYTDKDCFLETLGVGEAVYYSTSRNRRWKKGETSGDIQRVIAIFIDCDGDSLIYRVKQLGDGACHTKQRSCFYRSIDDQSICGKVDKRREKKKDKLKKVSIKKIGIGYKIRRKKIPGGVVVSFC